MVFVARPYQVEAKREAYVALRQHRSALVVMPTGCLALGTRVVMANGQRRPIESVEAGDFVLGPTGPREVLATVSGTAPMVRIHPVKGEPWDCTTDHVLTLVNTETDEILDVPVACWMMWPKSRKHVWKLIRSHRAEFGTVDVDLPIDPYFLGVLLGDGTLAKRIIEVTTMEPEVVAMLEVEAAKIGGRVRRAEQRGKAFHYRILCGGKRGRGHTHPLCDKMAALGLMRIESHERFVPEMYLMASADVRSRVLAGMIDTDGYSTCNCWDWISKSPRLADDFMFLARSLGLACYMRPKLYKGELYYRCSVSGDTDAIPCRVPRRQHGQRLQVKDTLRTGFVVEPLPGMKPFAGLQLDGDRRFFLGDFTITHNCGKTVTFADIIRDGHKAGKRALVLAHREELLDQAADKISNLAGVPVAIEQGSRKEAGEDAPVVIACVFSLIRRLDRFPADAFDLVIIDEAHRTLGRTYRELLAHFARAKVLGFTATPNRGDELALAQVYDAVAFDMSIGDAILDGWLVPIRTQSIELKSLDLSTVRKRNGELVAGELGAVMSEIAVLREAVGPSLDLASSKRSIVFTATRAQMLATAECIRLMALERRIALPIATLDGTTPDAERKAIIAGFRSGSIRWLVNVQVATEGFDVPEVEAIIRLSPTLSRARYVQEVGRGTRPLAGLVDGLTAADMTVRLDEAMARGAMRDPEGWLARAVLEVQAGGDAATRRLAIALSAKPKCLVIDFTDNSGKYDLANDLDLLGGDYELPDREEAQRLLAAGQADNLLDALERARAARLAKLRVAQARAGDPWALFGLSDRRDRFGRAPTEKQRRFLAPLQMPRCEVDLRMANTLLGELGRREDAGLCSYAQAALLARIGHPIDPIRELSRAEASAIIRMLARDHWQRPRDWPGIREAARRSVGAS